MPFLSQLNHFKELHSEKMQNLGTKAHRPSCSNGYSYLFCAP